MMLRGIIRPETAGMNKDGLLTKVADREFQLLNNRKITARSDHDDDKEPVVTEDSVAISTPDSSDRQAGFVSPDDRVGGLRRLSFQQVSAK